MKICILTPRFPFPEDGGDVLRINNICRYLKSKGHTLVLVSFHVGKQKRLVLSEQIYDKVYKVKHSKIISVINSMFALIINKPIQTGYYFSFSYLSMFKKVIEIEKPDLYISHLIRMVQYLSFCHMQGKSIIELTDALSKTYGLVNRSRKLSLKNIVYKIERKRVEKYEMKIIKTYKKCVLVSEADKRFLGGEL